MGLSSPHRRSREDQGLGSRKHSPGAAAGGAGTLALTPTPGGQGILSRGHLLTGQGTVTFNWLMSGEHFEDEKYQVGIVTIHFLR